MANVFDYIFNIGGNFTANIEGMSQAAGDFSAQIKSTQGAVQGLTTALARFDLIKNTMQGIADGFNRLSASGIKLDSSMHDLSAVAGVTGDGLKQIEKFARESAKTFGTDAAVAVEGINCFCRSCHRNWVNILRLSVRWVTVSRQQAS